MNNIVESERILLYSRTDYVQTSKTDPPPFEPIHARTSTRLRQRNTVHAEAVEASEVGVAVVAEDAQRDGLEGLVAQAVRVVDHAEVLHRLGGGAPNLVSALGDQPGNE